MVRRAQRRELEVDLSVQYYLGTRTTSKYSDFKTSPGYTRQKIAQNHGAIGAGQRASIGFAILYCSYSTDKKLY